MARGDDPAYGVVKTLAVDYTMNGRRRNISGQDPDTRDAEVFRDAASWESDRRLGLCPEQCHFVTLASGGEVRRIAAKILRQGSAVTVVLGRLSGITRRSRVLAGPQEPPARPVPLQAQGRRALVDRPARAVAE